LPPPSADQYHKSYQWLINQSERQLPGHHFLITFTVPEQIRRFIRSHQRICYAAMFKAASDTIKNWHAMKNTSAPICPAFSACCTLGDGNCLIIPTYTMSCPVGLLVFPQEPCSLRGGVSLRGAYIALFRPKMNIIGILHFFKLKRFSGFKDLSSQCHATHQHFYILNKSFTSYSDALCPFTVTEIITIIKAAFDPLLVSRFHMFVRIISKELF